MQDSDPQDEKKRTPRKHRRGLTRIAAACERCRRRKQKCDNRIPTCGPCTAAGVTCVLSDRLTVLADSTNYEADTLRLEVNELQKQVDFLTQQLAECRGLDPGESYIKNDHNINRRATLSSLASTGNPEDQNRLIEQSYTGRILRPTFVAENQSRIDAGDKSSVWNLWKDDHSVETPNENQTPSSNSSIEQYGPELIATFFEQRWPHLPVLHRPSFLRDHFLPFSQGREISGVSRFQVLMVFALASLERGRISSHHPYSHHEFFSMAVRDLNSVIAADDLSCIQCLLLLCMYGRTEPQSVNMWYTTGLALRIAVGMDLHRADSIRKMDLFQAEMSKRLFWSIYAMDRSMAMYLGRPLGIPDKDITLPFPLQLTDEDLESQNITTVIPRSQPDVKDTSTFIHVLKLRMINASIYRTFQAVKTEYLTGIELDNERQNIHGQLDEWLMSAPRYSIAASMFQSPEWFQIAYHHAILSLHRPSYAKPEPSIEALQLCADSSISLISCYGTLYAKNKVSYSFVALHSIFMAAVTMLYSLRASPQVRQDLTKQVIETNINSCLMLLRGISSGRGVAERASQIVTSLGNAVISLFNNEEQPISRQTSISNNREVDSEFLSWFGLKSRVTTRAAGGFSADLANTNDSQWQPSNLEDPTGIPTLSIDVAWEDLFAQGFGMDGSANLDFFPHTGF